MKTKTSASEKLENNRSVFLNIGFICALSFTLLAFEYKTNEWTVDVLEGTVVDFIDIDEIPITEQKELEKPLPKIISNQFEIVDNKTEIKEEPDFQSELTEIKEQVLIKVEEYKEEKVEEVEFLYIAQKMPEFPGGKAALNSFIKQNIKYPEMANKLGISGTVHVSFIVEPDGSLSNIDIVRSIGGGCDEEALRMINIMPRWKPAEQGNLKVRVKLTIPISFIIR